VVVLVEKEEQAFSDGSRTSGIDASLVEKFNLNLYIVRVRAK